MPFQDEEFPDSETYKKETYKEFRLSDIQEHNLKEIEVELKNKKINNSNKDTMLEYLEGLYNDITKIKEVEYAYEGEQNFNINRYLQRIKKLMQEIEAIA